ncbi:MAG TPA: gamma-glutamyltransferase family protein [Thermomicrobiales bacterium]|nr:gamma-glutamyltransferase family protein [Thermomicrobiales bacterium]
MHTDPAENLYPGDFPYPSRRMPVVAARGMVATSEPLAAQAGLEMLRRGGNAVDAALATAITLTVVEPTSNGIGADAFALIWDGATLHGLNGSGRAPATHTPDLFAGLGLTEVPSHGWLPVTVPGAPAMWRDLHAKFGKLPFAELFEPAIAYAEHGYPVGPVTANAWSNAARLYAERNIGPEFAGWFATFAPDGAGPRPGAIRALPDHARTLRTIAESNAEDFYRGDLAGCVADFAAATGGYITREDLAGHTSSWVEPIGTAYRGYEVWEIPPNGQGLAALEALNILEGFDLGRLPRESVESYHLQIEAMKLAFVDARRYIADMEHGEVPVRGLLDKEYAAERRRVIGERALLPEAGTPPRGGTVYLCAADGDGLMISMIQSNFSGFGSGIVVPGTGIALQNRGACFVLESGHLNCVAPRKRPYHTIIPAFLTRGGEAVGPFGVMGGFMQPQGHLQMVVNQVDYGLNPQASLDAPRWQWLRGREVAVETAVPQHIMSGLATRGHLLDVRYAGGSFGKGQIIRRLKNGAYVAGSEPRADGCAVGF